jgi:anthranilate phosphoribosyltransferase
MTENTVAVQDAESNAVLLEFLLKIRNRENLSPQEAKRLFSSLCREVNREVSMSEREEYAIRAAGILVALEMKGVTIEEIAGLAKAMRENAVPFKTRHRNFIDTAGTGGSKVKTFSVSTAAAFVIAGAGLPVAKHGNRSASNKFGSADVLEELGVNIKAAPEISQACLDGANICFLFAQKFHHLLGFLGRVRRQLAMPTVFNFLGPLANPANAPKQIVGVSDVSKIEPMAKALAMLKTERAWVIHGSDGLDEITTARETYIADVIKGKITTFTVEPEDFGLQKMPLKGVKAATAAESAQIIREVLEGKRRDAARNLVVMNAAAALVVGGISKQPMQAARLAEQSIDSDAARIRLQRLVETTNK